MRATAALALVMALAAAAVSAQPADGGRGGRGPRQTYANPSAVIAADLALSRAAREKGQWRALRDAAAPGALLFAPQAVDAATWLRRQPEPAAPERWQPRAVWMSCDGAYAVSRGAWTRGDESGEYVVVWERQKKGRWKWLLREEGGAADLGESPEMIAGTVAECSGLPRRRPSENAERLDPANAISADRSLRWTVQAAPDCSRAISVEAWDGRVFATVFTARRDPPPGGCG